MGFIAQGRGRYWRRLEAWHTVSPPSPLRYLTIDSLYSVPYATLAHTFSLIESTTKRLEKTAFLTSFLLLVIQRSAPGDVESLLHVIYLCINRVSGHFVLFEDPTHVLAAKSGLYRYRTGHWRKSSHQGYLGIHWSQ